MTNQRYCVGVVLALMSLAPLTIAQEETQAPAETTAADDFQVGMDAYNRGDLPAAMQSFRKAAEAGSADAQAWMGLILDYSENDEEAVAYYRASAEQGHVDGIAGLAEMYAKGDGVAKDLDEARNLFAKAAEKGHTRSIRALIAAYEKGGLGVEPDAERAAYWNARLADFESR
jgi:TPR repeat protein